MKVINKYKDTHKEVTTKQRIYTSMSETKNKGSRIEENTIASGSTMKR